MGSTHRLLVQEYLRTHTFGELEAEHGVNVTVSRSRPYKFSVNYDQIASKPSPLVNQCRGVVLRCLPYRELPVDAKEREGIVCGDTMLLARPFDRFFNHGDPNALGIDWDDPKLSVQEKLDGTLAIVYYDDVRGDWCMATRSVPDADLPFQSFDAEMTFRQLFDRALLATTGLPSLDEFTYGVHPDLTFCFELTSRWNRVVVDYSEERITWLGTRERGEGREFSHADTLAQLPTDLVRYFPAPAKVWSCSKLDEVQRLLETFSATEHEGVVVVDSSFRRVKMKSLAWLAANKIKSTCSTERALLSLVLAEKVDDVMAFLPADVQARVPLLSDGFVRLCANLDRAHGDFLGASGGSRKEYALKVQASGLWGAPLFDMYVRGRTAREWVMAKRDADGGWPDSFLEGMLDAIRKLPPEGTP